MGPKDIAVIILVVLGLAQISGFVLGFPFVEEFGFLSAASPMPLVFAWAGDESELLVKASAEVQSGGENVTVSDMFSVLAAIPGPHQRKVVYYHAVAYWPLIERSLSDPVLRHAWCGGVFSHELGLVDVRSVDMKFITHNKTYEVAIKCVN